MRKNKKGFTLVELIVVISILSILTIIAVPTTITQLNKSRDAEANTELTAACNYFEQNMAMGVSTYSMESPFSAPNMLEFISEAGFGSSVKAISFDFTCTTPNETLDEFKMYDLQIKFTSFRASSKVSNKSLKAVGMCGFSTEPTSYTITQNGTKEGNGTWSSNI